MTADDLAYLRLFCVDRGMFMDLLRLFDDSCPDRRATATLNVQASRRRGRPLALSNPLLLAMALIFLTSHPHTRVLEVMFGVCPRTLLDGLRIALDLLFDAVQRLPDARICFPPSNMLPSMFSAIVARSPLPSGLKLPRLVACWADGVRYEVPKLKYDSDARIWYCGYTHRYCCNNLYVKGPDGLIWLAVVNSPGTLHDSLLFRKIRPILEDKLGNTFCVMTDGGFRRSDPLVLAPAAAARTPKSAASRSAFDRLSTEWVHNTRAADEWLHQGLQATFRCLRDLPSDAVKRSRTIKMALGLFNFISRRIPGANQLRTVHIDAVKHRNRLLLSSEARLAEAQHDAQSAAALMSAEEEDARAVPVGHAFLQYVAAMQEDLAVEAAEGLINLALA